MHIVNPQPGSSTTVSLLLAAGIIAVLVGIVLSFPADVRADDCASEEDTHQDTEGVACGDAENHNDTVHYRIWTDSFDGRRGDTFTLKGRGFPTGTVTIFEGDATDREILATALIDEDDDGEFTETGLKARGSPVSLAYKVSTVDSEGKELSVTLEISKETISFDPAEAATGEPLTIIIEDYQDGHEEIVAARIAGKDAFPETVIEYPECIEYAGREIYAAERMLTLAVTVPPNILEGSQTVSLFDYNQLEVTPAGAAKPPCEDGQNGGEPVGRDARIALKADAEPTIRKTVEVVSELPPVSPLGLNILEVDGGRDRELTFQVDLPVSNRSSYLDAGDQIEISLPGFDLSQAAFDSQTARERIKIYGSNTPVSRAVSPTHVDAASGGEITLTLPAFELGAREHLNIAIEQGTGILTPEVPRGFDGTDEGYPITVSFIDAASGQQAAAAPNSNVVVVKNPISSSVPNTTVRIELATYAEAEIGPNQEITVDFSGPSADSEFVVPASITTSRISIRPAGKSSFNPSDVLIQGARVILTIPSGTSPKSVPVGEYEIRFSQLARIRSPFAAGNEVIKVSSSVSGDEPDEITTVIKRTTAIDVPGGPRGTPFTLEGKGYARGTVTVYHDADNDAQIDPGETLASVNTVRGAFTVLLEARGQRGDLEYRVRTRDSEGVGDEVVFLIRSGMFFNPPVARVGRPLQITISDWQNPLQGVAAVSVAGETAYVAKVYEYDNCFEYDGVFRADRDGRITLEIEVPRNVPAGKQTVSLYGPDQIEHSRDTDKGLCEDSDGGRGALVSRSLEASLRSEPVAIIKETIDIDTAELALSPSAAARGQKVTITGSGFTRSARGSDHIDSVWIGGTRVADDHSGFVVGSNGDIAFTVTVPLEVNDGPNELRIEGADYTLGQAALTIPEAVITLEPPLGQRGSDFTITGSGFIADSPVFITYGAGVGAPREEAQTHLLLADSQGKFELPLEVPYTAQVGKRHLVKAVAEAVTGEGAVMVEAEASHLIPWADITATPDTVSPGDRLNILGQGLPSFAAVGPIMIDGYEVLGRAGVATDETGSFETDVLVPSLDFGDHTLSIQVADVIVPQIITVAPPPLNGPPSQVFKYLIREGVLLMVWHYDNATQSWSVFEPSLPEDVAELNDLTEVESGDIVWMNLSEPQLFQENSLVAGWNLIALK